MWTASWWRQAWIGVGARAPAGAMKENVNFGYRLRSSQAWARWAQGYWSVPVRHAFKFWASVTFWRISVFGNGAAHDLRCPAEGIADTIDSVHCARFKKKARKLYVNIELSRLFYIHIYIFIFEIESAHVMKHLKTPNATEREWPIQPILANALCHFHHRSLVFL